MRFSYSDHLVGLLARVDVAAARLAAAGADMLDRLAADSRREVAYWSARLDGSPIEPETVLDVERRLAAGKPPIAELPTMDAPRNGWAGALRLDDLQSGDIAAVECANLLAAMAVEPDLAADFPARPLETLGALHGWVCAGLVDPQHIGRPRQTALAVHDGAQGRVIYNTPPPEAVPVLLAQLADWVTASWDDVSPLLVAGVVQERLLEWQPFAAANGRVARAASRVILRSRGIDPHGVVAVEPHLGIDMLGYHAEVAATIRRRGDLTLWLERYAEACVAGFESAAAVAHPEGRPAPPPRALALAGAIDEGETVTVMEYASRAGLSVAEARADLTVLSQAGVLRLAPGSRGLRYRR